MNLENVSLEIGVYKSKIDETKKFRISSNYFDLNIEDRLELSKLMQEWCSQEIVKLDNIKSNSF